MACVVTIGILLLTIGVVVLWYCTRLSEWQYRYFGKWTPAFLMPSIDSFRARTALGGMALGFAGGIVVLFAFLRAVGLSK